MKKYFYSLRPALALRWLRSNAAMPPMDLPTLTAELDLRRELRETIDELIVRKAEQSEIGTGGRVAALDRLIEEEFAAAERDSEPGGGRDLALTPTPRFATSSLASSSGMPRRRYLEAPSSARGARHRREPDRRRSTGRVSPAASRAAFRFARTEAAKP